MSKPGPLHYTRFVHVRVIDEQSLAISHPATLIRSVTAGDFSCHSRLLVSFLRSMVTYRIAMR